MSRNRVVAAVTLTAAGLGAAPISCTQVGADPNAIVALAFDSLPYPAVIAGDSLRNEAGVATALRATGLNVDGEEIPGAPFTFFALAAGVTISAEAFVLSTGTDAAEINVVAQTPGGLRSRELALRVTPRPDSMVLSSSTDTVKYVSDPEVTTPAVVVQLLSNVLAPTVTAVNGWVVRYQVEYNGTVLPTSDATTAWTMDEGGRRSAEDTTTVGGLASRRVRFRPAALGNPADSLVVIATAVRYGTPLVGSPLRIVVHLRPQLP